MDPRHKFFKKLYELEPDKIAQRRKFTKLFQILSLFFPKKYLFKDRYYHLLVGKFLTQQRLIYKLYKRIYLEKERKLKFSNYRFIFQILLCLFYECIFLGTKLNMVDQNFRHIQYKTILFVPNITKYQQALAILRKQIILFKFVKRFYKCNACVGSTNLISCGSSDPLIKYHKLLPYHVIICSFYCPLLQKTVSPCYTLSCNSFNYFTNKSKSDNTIAKPIKL